MVALLVQAEGADHSIFGEPGRDASGLETLGIESTRTLSDRTIDGGYSSKISGPLIFETEAIEISCGLIDLHVAGLRLKAQDEFSDLDSIAVAQWLAEHLSSVQERSIRALEISELVSIRCLEDGAVPSTHTDVWKEEIRVVSSADDDFALVNMEHLRFAVLVLDDQLGHGGVCS